MDSYLKTLQKVVQSNPEENAVTLLVESMVVVVESMVVEEECPLPCTKLFLEGDDNCWDRPVRFHSMPSIFKCHQTSVRFCLQ